MRSLTKTTPEPAALVRVRGELSRLLAETGRDVLPRDWELLKNPDKQAVREQLHRDQRGLCAYCMRPISTADADNDPVGMRIEHFEPRTAAPSRMFNWTNLLGVCAGEGMHSGAKEQTCDRARGSRTLRVNPYRRSPAPEDAFRYSRPRSSTPVEAAGVDVNSHVAPDDVLALNLNAGSLRIARAAVIQRLRGELRAGRTVASLLRTYEAAHGGTLPAFAGVATAYLLTKL